MNTLLATLLLAFNTYSVFGVIHLVLFVLALINIIDSSRSLASKILWIAIVFFLPLIGLILYYLIGKK